MRTPFLAIAGLSSILTLHTSSAYPSSFPAPRVVWEPSTPAWLECITERRNGDLLITRFDTGQIWSVSKNTGEPALVYEFSNSSSINSALGITEYQDDVFAVNAGQTQDGLPVHGTWGLWAVDLRGWHPERKQLPAVTLIVKIPDAAFLNGLTVLNPATTRGPRSQGVEANPFFLLADSSVGAIYGVDLANKTPSIFYSNPELLAPPANAPFPAGLNGIQLPAVRKPEYVYFSAGLRGTFYRLKLANNAPAVAHDAEMELLIEGYQILDDFALEADGTAYLATSVENKIVRLSPGGNQTIIAQGDIVASSTAVLLTHRGSKKILYVTSGTRGSDPDLISGKLTEITL
ncbi:Six-bladed beta-propeller TolB-like protein [Ilyonectria robusta]